MLRYMLVQCIINGRKYGNTLQGKLVMIMHPSLCDSSQPDMLFHEQEKASIYAKHTSLSSFLFST
jgi:hypothetical protein